MPNAVCKDGHIVRWSNRRGTRLKELRCPDDHTELRRINWDSAEYRAFETDLAERRKVDPTCRSGMRYAN